MTKGSPLDGVERIHMIGIGGIGVSAVARILLARGYKITGSDVRESQITKAIRAEGGQVTIGHNANLIDGADLVVYSTAIPDTNPELVAARNGSARVLHRAEILGALLHGYTSVGVIGTHGKGTVSAMVTRVMDAGGHDPSFIIGGLLNDYGCNARATQSDVLVVEIDESDGSLVHVRPQTLVVNNIEADHLNYYGDLEGVYEKIGNVIANENGRDTAVLHVGDAGVRELLTRINPQRTIRFGFEDDLAGHPADVVGRNLEVGPLGSTFSVSLNGANQGIIEMRQPGRYNAMNALAATATAIQLGVPFDKIQEGLRAYSGIENRFTIVDAGPVRVVKDYISHPTGIRRVLAAAKTLADGPITAVFKPYRFTMIHYLGDEYAVAFKDATHTVITELYTAGEVPIPGVDVHWLIDKIRSTGSEVTFVPDMDDIVSHLKDQAVPGQQIIFFGGDDLFQLADQFIEQIRDSE